MHILCQFITYNNLIDRFVFDFLKMRLASKLFQMKLQGPTARQIYSLVHLNHGILAFLSCIDKGFNHFFVSKNLNYYKYFFRKLLKS